jgi:hypothetical protein
MTPLKLKSYHNIGQFFITYGFSGSQLGYIIILAKYAIQVTMRKKNRAGAIKSNQGRFFSKMWPVGGYHRIISCMTISFFIFSSFDFAPVGAEYTGF